MEMIRNSNLQNNLDALIFVYPFLITPCHCRSISTRGARWERERERGRERACRRLPKTDHVVLSCNKFINSENIKQSDNALRLNN